MPVWTHSHAAPHCTGMVAVSNQSVVATDAAWRSTDHFSIDILWFTPNQSIKFYSVCSRPSRPKLDVSVSDWSQVYQDHVRESLVRLLPGRSRSRSRSKSSCEMPSLLRCTPSSDLLDAGHPLTSICSLFNLIRQDQKSIGATIDDRILSQFADMANVNTNTICHTNYHRSSAIC